MDKNLYVVIFETRCIFEEWGYHGSCGLPDSHNYAPVLVKNSSKSQEIVRDLTQKAIKNTIIDDVYAKNKSESKIAEVKIGLIIYDPIPIADFGIKYKKYKQNQFYNENLIGENKFKLFVDLDKMGIEHANVKWE